MKKGRLRGALPFCPGVPLLLLVDELDLGADLHLLRPDPLTGDAEERVFSEGALYAVANRAPAIPDCFPEVLAGLALLEEVYDSCKGDDGDYDQVDDAYESAQSVDYAHQDVHFFGLERIDEVVEGADPEVGRERGEIPEGQVPDPAIGLLVAPALAPLLAERGDDEAWGEQNAERQEQEHREDDASAVHAEVLDLVQAVALVPESIVVHEADETIMPGRLADLKPVLHLSPSLGSLPTNMF